MISFLKSRLEQAKREIETKSISKDKYVGKLLEIRATFKYVVENYVNNYEVAEAQIYIEDINNLLR